MRVFLLLTFSIGINCIYAQCPAWQARVSDPQSIPSQSNFIGNSTGWIIKPEISDTFNGTTIDLSKWSVKNDSCHGSLEMSYYRPYNVSVSNGRLILGFQYDPNVINCGVYSQHYSAGWVELNNPVHYGYIEVRHKLPTDLNMVPCFWLWGAIPGKYDEIDVGEYIFELPNNKAFRCNLYRTYQTYESKQEAHKNFTSSLTGQDVVYAVEWFPNEINFYINGEVVQCNKFTTDMKLVSPAGYKPVSEYTCTNFTNMIAQRLQLSFTVMGNTNNYSQHYEVDYVKSYKLQHGIIGLYWPATIEISDPNISKVHSDIQLGGDNNHLGYFPSGKKINFWATNSITLEKGVEIPSGDGITFRIVQTDADCYISNNTISED